MKTKKRTLVVDDDLAILNFIRVSLSMAGYEVITATNGEAALKLVDSNKPDIMVLDLAMLPMTGFEVLERLRGFSEMPVIISSARSDVACQAMQAGANGFVAKPFRPEHLIQKIQEILVLTRPERKLQFSASSLAA